MSMDTKLYIMDTLMDIIFSVIKGMNNSTPGMDCVRAMVSKSMVDSILNPTSELIFFTIFT